MCLYEQVFQQSGFPCAEEAIEKSLSKAMETVQSLFVGGSLFVPDLLLAAEAFEKAVAILNENNAFRAAEA